MLHHGKGKLIDISENSKTEILYIVLEYASNGDLFDNATISGRFSEK